jgi:hypothetical protein
MESENILQFFTLPPNFLPAPARMSPPISKAGCQPRATSLLFLQNESG